MSFAAAVLEGAQRAAQFATLLFSLNVATPAAGQQAPAKPPSGSIAIDGPLADAPLTLTAHHLDVQVEGASARVRTTLVLRNDRSTAVAAQYLLSYPARVQRGARWQLRGAAGFDADCDDAALASDDLSPAQAEAAEVERPVLTQPREVITVQPGEEIALEVRRVLPVEGRDGVHRLALPLPVDRDAPWVPRFSADVRVEAERPVRRLASPTHEALVTGLGERTALLSVPEGFVYRQEQLAVEFELAAPAAGSAPLAAIGVAPHADATR